MPIEFPCPQCGRTLRTPDGSAGKRAKCPSCETVTEIPASSASSPSDDNPFGQPAAGGGSENPFAGLDGGSSGGAPAGNPFGESGSQSGGFADPQNPYASPHAEEYQPGPAPVGEIRHGRIDFGEVMSSSWSIFSSNMGNLIVVALILIGIVIGCYIGFAVLIGIGVAIGASAQDPTIAAIATVCLLILGSIAALFMGGWLGAGITRYSIDTCRGYNPPFSVLFSGQKYMLRMTGFMFVTQVIIGQGLILLCVLPGFLAEDEALQLIGQYTGQAIGGLINGLFFALAPYFMVDRDSSFTKSIGESVRFLSGNRLILFLLYLVITIVGMLFMMVTCCIGVLFYIPYYFVFMAVVYLYCTSQPMRA